MHIFINTFKVTELKKKECTEKKNHSTEKSCIPFIIVLKNTPVSHHEKRLNRAKLRASLQTTWVKVKDNRGPQIEDERDERKKMQCVPWIRLNLN